MEPSDQHSDNFAVKPGRVAFQPNGTHDVEFLDMLATEEASDEARRLQRIADNEIIAELGFLKFDTDTPEWEEFAAALAEYGYSVLMGWLITGSIFRMAAAQRQGKGVHGLHKLPDDLRLTDRDEAHALATEVLIVAIDRFRRRTLMNPDSSKRWRIDGGASIKTFFIGRCLMELPDVYKKWNRHNSRSQTNLKNFEQLSPNDEPVSVDPQTQAVATIDLDRIFQDESPLTRVMFELQAEGYTYGEIAEMLTEAGHSTTQPQVRSTIFRARQTAKAPTS